jgi:hypothetical protein
MKRVNWRLVIAIFCGVWLALMIGVSYFGYMYKSPVRIENWKPETVR